MIIDNKKTENFSELVKDFFTKLPQPGDLVKGKVISVDSGAIRLDINGVVTGVIRGKELFAESKQFSNLKVDDEVEAGIALIVTEAMKMETEIQAPVAGKITAIYVQKGDSVNPDEVLIEID